MFKLTSLLVVLAGCAHQKPSQVAAGDDSLGQAYETVASGERSTARVGGYLIEKTSGDKVRVVSEAPIGGLGTDVSDALITAKVKGRLGYDQETHAARIHVTTDAGMVTLQGRVDSRTEAMKAIRDALATDGVTAVDSQLQWPQQMRAKANGSRM